jgi:hypothetical protein
MMKGVPAPRPLGRPVLRIRGVLLLCGAVLGGGTVPAGAETRILTVVASGNYQYRMVSAAVAVANADVSAGNYYKIRVAPGTYTNDFPVVTRPMTIEVDPSGAGSPVLLKATVPLPKQKGIILTFASLTVDGLTFSGAMIDNSSGGNGAGIRDQNTAGGAALTVRNSVFSENQEGILTGATPARQLPSPILNS